MKSKKSYERSLKIHFRDADPAGIMYFANLFSFAHDTFESFIVDAGIPWNQWFQDNKHLVPIRHAECDYLSPFFPGKTYQVLTQVESISDSTFRMRYTFFEPDSAKSREKKIHAVVKIAHTFVDPKSKKKSNIPKEFRAKITPYLISEIKKGRP